MVAAVGEAFIIAALAYDWKTLAPHGGRAAGRGHGFSIWSCHGELADRTEGDVGTGQADVMRR
jgi:hypothetical protein